ncbi:MAG: glycosyltransferase [Thermodesulfobacteriota bacterium]|nr:glycosyltransferase [Thermodesulfobacteriota bacterium]
MKEISIVIPSKDEEITIAKCIESVENALEGVRSYEIILVDSYSSDRTVEIATKYPIKILRLRQGWPISPSAGRYIGSINSHGKYIFFLDADMVVDKDWIKKGLEILEKDHSLAGVTGLLFNILPFDKVNKRRLIRHPIGYVKYLPGTAIYRRSIIEEVNHFNPFLMGYEERELGYRITERGYKLIRLKDAISYHFAKEQNLRELHEKSRYFIGVGQFLRLHFTIENLYEIAKTYHLILWTNLFLLMFFISFILSILTGNFILPKITSAFALFLCITLIIRHRNIKKSCLFVYGLFSKSLNIVYGFLKKTKKFNEYPLDVEIIK